MTIFPLYIVVSISDGPLCSTLRDVPLHEACSNQIHSGVSLSLSKIVSLHQAIMKIGCPIVSSEVGEPKSSL